MILNLIWVSKSDKTRWRSSFSFYHAVVQYLISANLSIWLISGIWINNKEQLLILDVGIPMLILNKAPENLDWLALLS